jgi:hypothetical protein
MSVTKDQAPQGNFPSVAPVRPASATAAQVMPSDGCASVPVMRSTNARKAQTKPYGDDPAVAIVRETLADGTAGSVKRSVLACLIIWTAGRSLRPRGLATAQLRRRIRTLFIVVASVVLVPNHYWHAFSGLVRLLH